MGRSTSAPLTRTTSFVDASLPPSSEGEGSAEEGRRARETQWVMMRREGTRVLALIREVDVLLLVVLLELVVRGREGEDAEERR